MLITITVLGIDLGKNSCSVVGLDAGGRVVLRRRLHREGVIKLAAGLPSCVMAVEACCGAHHLGRRLRVQGHKIRLMSPEYVRPYVKAQKNDDRDAEAIAEAATRPTMRFVELKSEEQLDRQSLHRARDRLVGERRRSSTSCVPSCWSAMSSCLRGDGSWRSQLRACSRPSRPLSARGFGC